MGNKKKEKQNLMAEAFLCQMYANTYHYLIMTNTHARR